MTLHTYLLLELAHERAKRRRLLELWRDALRGKGKKRA